MLGETFGYLDDIDQKTSFIIAPDALTFIPNDLSSPSGGSPNPWQEKGFVFSENMIIVRGHIADVTQKQRREGLHGGKKGQLQLFMDARNDNGQAVPDDSLIYIFVNFAVADPPRRHISFNIVLLIEVSQPCSFH